MLQHFLTNAIVLVSVLGFSFFVFMFIVGKFYYVVEYQSMFDDDDDEDIFDFQNLSDYVAPSNPVFVSRMEPNDFLNAVEFKRLVDKLDLLVCGKTNLMITEDESITEDVSIDGTANKSMRYSSISTVAIDDSGFPDEALRSRAKELGIKSWNHPRIKSSTLQRKIEEKLNS